MRLERPRRHVRAVAPHLAQQPLAREDALRILGELDEQRPLLRGEHDLAAAREHAPRGAVDRQLAEIELLLPRRPAPQQRTDPRDELLVRERLRQIVVAPLERAHAQRRVGVAEHDHGTVRHAAALERRRVAEHEDVGLRRARQVVGAAEREDVEAVARELTLEEAAHGRFRLGEEKRSHSGDRSRGFSPAPDVLPRGSATTRLQPAGTNDGHEQPGAEDRRQHEAERPRTR